MMNQQLTQRKNILSNDFVLASPTHNLNASIVSTQRKHHQQQNPIRKIFLVEDKQQEYFDQQPHQQVSPFNVNDLSDQSIICGSGTNFFVSNSPKIELDHFYLKRNFQQNHKDLLCRYKRQKQTFQAPSIELNEFFANSRRQSAQSEQQLRIIQQETQNRLPQFGKVSQSEKNIRKIRKINIDSNDYISEIEREKIPTENYEKRQLSGQSLLEQMGSQDFQEKLQQSNHQDQQIKNRNNNSYAVLGSYKNNPNQQTQFNKQVSQSLVEKDKEKQFYYFGSPGIENKQPDFRKKLRQIQIDDNYEHPQKVQSSQPQSRDVSRQSQLSQLNINQELQKQAYVTLKSSQFVNIDQSSSKGLRGSSYQMNDQSKINTSNVLNNLSQSRGGDTSQYQQQHLRNRQQGELRSQTKYSNERVSQAIHNQPVQDTGQQRLRQPQKPFSNRFISDKQSQQIIIVQESSDSHSDIQEMSQLSSRKNQNTMNASKLFVKPFGKLTETPPPKQHNIEQDDSFEFPKGFQSIGKVIFFQYYQKASPRCEQSEIRRFVKTSPDEEDKFNNHERIKFSNCCFQTNYDQPKQQKQKSQIFQTQVITKQHDNDWRVNHTLNLNPNKLQNTIHKTQLTQKSQNMSKKSIFATEDNKAYIDLEKTKNRMKWQSSITAIFKK